jgi:hypothetical protein
MRGIHFVASASALPIQMKPFTISEKMFMGGAPSVDG